MFIDNDNETFAYEPLAIDRGSVRTVDDNGFLHVKISPLTRVQVAPYYGKEIPGWQSLGLEANKIYKGYRPESELQKASTLNSVNGIPIQLRHHPDFADSPAKETRIGATGTDAKFTYPFLMNSLHFFDKKAKELIESDALRELSLAYRYKPDFTPGKAPNGQDYDFVMRDISGNHLALVEQGRAGHQVLVYDSKQEIDDMDIEQVTTLVNDALDKKLAGFVNSLNKLTERVNKYVGSMEDKEETKAEEKTEAEEIVTDKCGGKKKVAKDEEKPKAEDKPEKAKKIVDEEGEEVEEVKEYDVEKLKDSKKAEKTEAEPEAEGEEDDEAEEEVIEDKKAKKSEKPEEKKVETKAKDEEEIEEEEISVDSKKALKDAGLENAADYVQKAFLSGCNDENIKLYEKARKEEKETKSIAQDEKIFTEEDVTQAYNTAKQDLMAEIEAIEVCKPVLGNIKIGAYDSANDIYLEACKELNLTCDSANARDVYNAYQMSKKNVSVKTGTTGNRGKTKDGIERIFDNVFSNM